jgi:hypothetical protein
VEIQGSDRAPSPSSSPGNAVWVRLHHDGATGAVLLDPVRDRGRSESGMGIQVAMREPEMRCRSQHARIRPPERQRVTSTSTPDSHTDGGTHTWVTHRIEEQVAPTPGPEPRQTNIVALV